MPAIADKTEVFQPVQVKANLTDVRTQDLLRELAARIEADQFGMEIMDAFDILDRRRFPVCLLKNDTWFSCYGAVDPQTIGRVISGGKSNCDVLVEFVRKLGNNVNERYHISSATLIRPLRPEEVPPSCFGKVAKARDVQKPVVEAVECINPDDIFSEPVAAIAIESDDLFSE